MLACRIETIWDGLGYWSGCRTNGYLVVAEIESTRRQDRKVTINRIGIALGEYATFVRQGDHLGSSKPAQPQDDPESHAAPTHSDE